jgi:hypothetical protein
MANRFISRLRGANQITGTSRHIASFDLVNPLKIGENNPAPAPP